MQINYYTKTDKNKQKIIKKYETLDWKIIISECKLYVVTQSRKGDFQFQLFNLFQTLDKVF